MTATAGLSALLREAFRMAFRFDWGGARPYVVTWFAPGRPFGRTADAVYGDDPRCNAKGRERTAPTELSNGALAYDTPMRIGLSRRGVVIAEAFIVLRPHGGPIILPVDTPLYVLRDVANAV